MIQCGEYILPGPGHPVIVGKHFAEAPCRCRVYVGIRSDNKEAATLADSCSMDHESLMERFNLALTDSLANPTSRPLIDVVDEMLDRIYHEEVQGEQRDS